MSKIDHQPSWLDKKDYPFQSKFLNISGGNLHYIDEGKGPIILFVHGTPMWSFLYRKQIAALSKEFRCIAVDHLGFGLSSSPEDFNYTPEAHALVLEQLIDQLNLSNINLVVHDFGGPIGLANAIKQPARFNSLTIMNSWLWPFDNDPEVVKISKMLSGKFGKFLYKSLNFSVKFLLPKGFSDKKRLTKALHQQYIHPFKKTARRHATWVFARELEQSSTWFKSLEMDIDKLSEIPTQILWGMSDTLIKPIHLEKWKQLTANFDDVSYLELDNVGHFVQEEAPQDLIDNIRKTAR